jgi:hypothetical protein
MVLFGKNLCDWPFTDIIEGYFMIKSWGAQINLDKKI